MSGWKLVPLGQTEEMYDALSATGKLWRDMNSEKVWRVQAKAAPSPPEDVLERMARAGDAEDAAQCGEPSPWLAPGVELTGEMAKEYQEFRAARIAVYRAALAAAEGRE